MRRLPYLLFLCFVSTVAFAQKPPSPGEFLGYEVGSRFTSHERIAAYFEQLDAASPRVKVEPYGESWEGRRLIYAVITSEANHQALTERRRELARLTAAGTTRAEAEKIAADAPIVVWLGYGVHGDEASSSEAAMLAAWYLATDEGASVLLDRAIVIIDPLQNPDGHETYTQTFRQRTGLKPNLDPNALEHSGSWPNGRDNHFLVDLNRDWLWATQRETQARIAAYRQWNPHVFIDLHEMSYHSSYFFPPSADPINSNIAPGVEKWLETFGRANGAAFSRRAWPFFVGESFDLFYPGYGDSWATLRGTIGMTFEAGGKNAGLAVRREDETVLSLGDRVQRHFLSSVTSIDTAVKNRTALILHSWEALHHTRPLVQYVVDAPFSEVESLARMLERQGIDMQMLRRPMRAKAMSILDGTTAVRALSAGSLVVTTKQPLGAVVQSFFERSADLPDNFVNEQRLKMEAEEPDDFYDITAWNVALALNLPVLAVEGELDLAPWVFPDNADRPIPAAHFGYLIPAQQSDFYRVLGSLLQKKVRFSVSTTELGAQQQYPRGTLLIERQRNDASLDAALRDALRGTSVQIVPVQEVWSEGPALGSSRIVFVRPPRIAIVAGHGFEQRSVGSIWFTFDVDTGIPHTVVPPEFLVSSELGKYDVVILPHSTLDIVASLGKNAPAKLKSWVEGGGTLIAVKGSATALRAADVGLSSLKPPKKEDEKKGESTNKQGDEKKFEPAIPGAAFRTVMNERSYLTFGLARPPAVLLGGNPPVVSPSNKRETIISFAEKEPLLSGFAWPETAEQLQGATYVAHERIGAGSVITFADDPVYRLFWRATMPILLNAAVYSSSINR